MSQEMPVIRQLYWPGLLPQFTVIGGLAIGFHLAIPAWRWNTDALVGAVVYAIICRALRQTLAREHVLGMGDYRAQRFSDARDHFRQSYAFFTVHPRIDWWRFFLFGSTSRNPYRTLALCNEAFCESQLENGAAAIALYEQALRITPHCTLATASLRMLRSTAVSEPGEKAASAT
jgi:hypothetical protein